MSAALLLALALAAAPAQAATAELQRELLAAARAGDAATVRRLIAAGADPDARDRAFGTPLDVAERAGHNAIAELLRRNGARGSGRSTGDRVCVLRWRGQGFCGRIEAIAGTRYRLRLDRLRGCEAGCAADRDCSEGRDVGGTGAGGVSESDVVWTQGWCLTHTGVE